MIEFQRRTLPCWEVCEDYDRAKTIPLLYFNNIPELMVYVANIVPGEVNIQERESIAYYNYQIMQGQVVLGAFKKLE